MGLLSSVLSVGGAALGGLVGGPVGAKLGGALGGAAGGALSSSKGSKKATAAQLAAQAEARRIQGQAYSDVRGFQQPYQDFGTANVNALTARLGLPQPASPAPPTTNALTGAPAAPVMGGFAGTSPLEGDPGIVGAPVAPGAPPQSQPQPTAPMNALSGNPTTLPAPAPSQPAVDPGTYGSTANPTAPEAFSYGVDDYKASPAFEGRLRRMTDNVQSSAAAQGSLFSGNTLKELADRSSDLYLEDFNRERQFAYGQNRDQRSDYQDDRGYLTNRFDNQTSNLFRGVGIGQGAAGAMSGAATRYGDQVAGLVQAGGDARAQNALTQGQIGSDFASGLGGILSGAFGGAAQPVARNADPYGVGQVNYGNSLRMTSPYRF